MAEKPIERTWKFRLLWGLVKFAAHCPLRILYRLSDVVCFLLYRVVGYRRKIVRTNFNMAFPNVDAKTLRRWERGFYQFLSDVFVETVKLAHFPDSEVDRRITIVNAEIVNESLKNGRSVVLMLGHYGNWEWVTSVARKFTEPAVICEIYHPLTDKVMDALMLKLRSRFDTENIAMKRTVRQLLEIERSGEKFVCGFIADQRPSGSEHKHWTEFMDVDTDYMVGGEVIGDKIGATFLYLDVERPKRGHYCFTIKPIVPPTGDSEPYPYTREYLRMLEATIRRNPSLWLWSHNRWSRSRAKQAAVRDAEA